MVLSSAAPSGAGAEQRGVKRSELGGAAPSEARRSRRSTATRKLPKPLKRRPTHEAKAMVPSSRSPGEARHVRRSAAAQKPLKPPTTRDAKAVVLSTAAQ